MSRRLAQLEVLELTSELVPVEISGPASDDRVQVQSFECSGPDTMCYDPPEDLSAWQTSWADTADPISEAGWHPT